MSTLIKTSQFLYRALSALESADLSGTCFSTLAQRDNISSSDGPKGASGRGIVHYSVDRIG